MAVVETEHGRGLGPNPALTFSLFCGHIATVEMEYMEKILTIRDSKSVHPCASAFSLKDERGGKSGALKGAPARLWTNRLNPTG